MSGLSYNLTVSKLVYYKPIAINCTIMYMYKLITFSSDIACVAGGIREWASGGGAAYYLAGLAREGFHVISCDPSEINP